MAGAATTLTGGNSAEAEIHYSGIVNIKLSGREQASFPLSNGASLVFYLLGDIPSFCHSSALALESLGGLALGAAGLLASRKRRVGDD